MTFWQAILMLLLQRGAVDATTTRVVVAPAETLAVTMSGSGAPVVIIPGMLGGAFGFRKVTALLNARHEQVVIIDPLGTGGSSHPRAGDYSMQAQAVRIAAALDSVGIRHALVVGHAAGVPVALRMALLRPGIVSGVVLVNGSASEIFSAGALRVALRLAPIIRLFGGEKKAQNHVVNGLRANSADDSWVTNEVVAKYTAPYKDDFTATLRVLKAVATAPEPWLLLPRLTRVRVPVLLVIGTGAKEASIKPEEVTELRAVLRSLRVETLSSVGHFVQEERPDLLVQAINSVR